MSIKAIHVFLILSWSCLVAGCGGRAMEPGSNPLEPEGGTVVASEIREKTFRVPEHFNGFNAQLMRGPSWNEPGFAGRVRELNPSVIRYPGGTVASYWDWKKGSIDATLPIRNSWRNIEEVVPNRLEDLKYACDQTGAVPLFVLNMVHGTLQGQLNMLAHARGIGLPVRYVELDNELYLGDEDYVKRFPTGANYGREANQWIAALKKNYPGVKVAVVGYASRESGVNPKKPNANRTQNWNRDVLSVIRQADAMTFHLYGGSGLNFLGSVGGNEDSEERAEQLQRKFSEPRAPDFVLTASMMRWATAEVYDYRILPDGMKAWITEYNLFEKEGVVAGTWAHGLYALLLSMQFMNEQRTEMICYHNLSTSAQFAAIFNSSDGFFKSVVQKPTTKFDFTAAGHTLRLFGEALDGAREAVSLDFKGAKMVTGARGKTYCILQGWKFRKQKGSAVLMVNISPTTVQADISGLGAVYFRIEGLHATPQTQIGSSSDLRSFQSKGSLISLPPYSVMLAESD
jgi:hypothetical protein